ncbi:hypothetical protein SEA_TANDEM_8 [Microbacterium phage Tandem]|nr:hypothetical protein SEA_TANDEM_8 [Microbacterium phage Tandem]
MSNADAYSKAQKAFGAVRAGDRVRVTEEFVVEEVKNGILYYRAEEAERDVPLADRWEYWPTEHTKEIVIIEAAH